MQMSHSSHDFDVVIIGGGPAGCATALSLLNHGSSPIAPRVLLIDDTVPLSYKIGESLPAAAKRTLPQLDPSLLPRLMRDTTNGIHDICSGNASAWASAAVHETYAIMNLYGSGWHLDRVHFDETLREACSAVFQQGRFISVKRFSSATPEAHMLPRAPDCNTVTFGWQVEVEMAATGATEQFNTRWIVDATGRKASVAHKLGAKIRRHHDLLTFYCLFDSLEDPDSANPSQRDHDTRTLIEASPSGWWYTARLPRGKRIITYTTSPSDPTARLARDTQSFLDLLYSQTVHVAKTLRCSPSDSDRLYSGDAEAHIYQASDPLYELPPLSKRSQCTAAGSSVLEPYASWDDDLDSQHGEGRGWCAVGDAALAFDPLSSQGIITALDAGAFLGTLLARRLSISSKDTHAGIASDPDTPLSPAPGMVDVAHELTAAYERIRQKYEHSRDYYYEVVRRFDADVVETDLTLEENGTGNTAKHAGKLGYTSFWKGQRPSS